MWIRSQSKETLGNYEVFWYSSNTKDKTRHSVHSSSIDGESWHLGAYKSEERALEVIDEIQDYVGKSKSVNLNNGCVENMFYIHQMPKE